jgi:RNA polymerase sigma factor (sigma-70 family)
MSDSHSVSEHLNVLTNPEATDSGLEQAAAEIYQRYSQPLQEYIKFRCQMGCARVVDEEDIVQEAMVDLLRGAPKGRFRELDNRQDLWQVLRVLAKRRAIDQFRRETAAVYGNGEVRGESVFDSPAGSSSEIAGLDGHPEGRLVPRNELSPWMIRLIEEEFQQWMDLLSAVDREKPRSRLQEIAQLRYEGHTVAEIAKRFDCSTRTIEKRLELIRKIWSKHKKPEQAEQTDAADSRADES